ncbi:MAG: serine hydrolase, partial [Acidobacteria bacterium]|nr:serine hydrolase [Acidobacteriota bacterium]
MVDGAIVFERYEKGYSAGDSLNIHSGTKSFWGPVIAAMIEDGLISSFDERVADTLIEWESEPRKSRITVRQLLNLTCGLEQKMKELRGLFGSAKDKYQYAIGLKAVREPGEHFEYGPSCFYALGELLKRKLKPKQVSPLGYLSYRIFEKIGLRPTGWEHDPAGNPHIPNGAYITARGWLKFGQLRLQGGAWDGRQIIKRDLLKRCFEGSDANCGYGLTFWLNLPGGWSARPKQKASASAAGGW